MTTIPAPDTAPPPSPTADPAAIEVHALTKRFGTRVAVDAVDLLVPTGTIFGYLGPNGAGKTTLIRALLGLTTAEAGTVSLLGIPVPQQRGQALARVGAIVDEPRFHRHLTGRENLALLGAARGPGARRQIAPALERTRLTQRADDRVATYSMGMRQRLGLAACLLADPKLLILDEPMNGLDPSGRHEMRELILGLAAEGRTVLLSSHLLDEVERTCDQVAIVDNGKVVRQGPIEDLLAGSESAVEVHCADPAAAARVLAEFGSRLRPTDGGLTVALGVGPVRAQIAEINRRLVAASIAVYGLTPVHTSLEQWFLSVTSRLGEHS